ncbi:hypothetical protein EGW08_017309 [Elysia chlorotica]|uniref:Sushi domain-containing protein n=1 Tax=Elysia chlorotica TaxID=188477 RepID=A0A433T057_ELYCH|nr:hypothetical protein EGW08_017309 [Elysia chlorotica]
MASKICKRTSLTAAIILPALYLLILSIWTAEASVRISNQHWTGLHFNYGRRFTRAQAWVSLDRLNIVQCLRLCWLFRACTALNFSHDVQRCELYRLGRVDEDLYSMEISDTSQAVDMRMVSMATRGRLSREGKGGGGGKVPSLTGFRDGVGSVVYTCVQGFYHTGSNFVSTCDDNSKSWSDVDITCTLVDCGPPSPAVGAEMSSPSSTYADSEVSYTCLTGAVPSTPVMASTCVGQTGQWSETPGPCTVVSCGPPPPVDTMDVELTTRSSQGAFPGLTNYSLDIAYGGQAVYTCKHGYTQPDGARYISLCQEDGTWSSTSDFRCLPVTCNQPPRVDNSIVNLTTVPFGSQATVTCETGFSPLESVTLMCHATGTWDGPEVTCDPVKCAEPPELENAIVVYNSTDYEATAQYKCVELTLKQGEDNSTSQCMGDGEWSAVGLVCITIPCGSPPTVNNSTAFFFSTDNEIYVDYVCDEGFEHEGE